MDNGGILCKISDFSCDPVVKSCSDGKQEVTAADGKVGGITSMNSEISNVEGMEEGRAPLPMIVVTTGIFVISASLVISRSAPEMRTPPPTKKTGFSDWFNSPTAFFIWPIWTEPFGLQPLSSICSG